MRTAAVVPFQPSENYPSRSEEATVKTFYAIDNNFKEATHRTARIRLSRGEQGIPQGFELEAVCGATAEVYALDLMEDDALVTC